MAGFATFAFATFAVVPDPARLASRDAKIPASLAAASWRPWRSPHLAARIAVEIDAGRARDEASQIHHAPDVDTKGHTQHAPLNGRAVGGYSNLQRPVRPVLFQHECLREFLGEARQGGVYILVHPALHR